MRKSALLLCLLSVVGFFALAKASEEGRGSPHTVARFNVADSELVPETVLYTPKSDGMYRVSLFGHATYGDYVSALCTSVVFTDPTFDRLPQYSERRIQD